MSLDPLPLVFGDADMVHDKDFVGWLVSVKLRGYFVRWDGERMCHKKRCYVKLPEYVTKLLPSKSKLHKRGLRGLDGVIYCSGVGGYDAVTRMVSSADWSDWAGCVYMGIFDAVPLKDFGMPFEERLRRAQQVMGVTESDLKLKASTVGLAKLAYIGAVVNRESDRRTMLPEPNTVHMVTYCRVKGAAGLLRLKRDVSTNVHAGLVFRHPDGVYDSRSSSETCYEWVAPRFDQRLRSEGMISKSR